MAKLFTGWLAGAIGTGGWFGARAGVVSFEQRQYYDSIDTTDPLETGLVAGIFWPVMIPLLAVLHTTSHPIEVKCGADTYSVNPGSVKWYPAGGLKKTLFGINNGYRTWAIETNMVIKKQS